MDQSQIIEEQTAALRSHLVARREAVLQRWRKLAREDPQLSSASSLPRSQFNDHIPAVLDDLDRRLQASLPTQSSALPAQGSPDATAHGMQRWQQGYHLREVTREWGHLHLCLVDELEDYALAHPELLPAVISGARRALARLCSEGVSESAAQYFHLQQVEAEGHLSDLEQAMRQFKDMEAERAEMWRQAAHDLRGNLGAVANATAGLALDGVPQATRQRFLRLLQRNLSSLHSMLDDVTNLARLQAGRERRDVRRFDAARLVVELCDGLQVEASERGLYLRTDGPATLQVEGDAVKAGRIAQNLLLNALKYTREGGVTVTWGDSRPGDEQRWMLVVQDSGPGFHSGPGAPLAGALEEATEESRQVDRDAGERPVPDRPGDAVASRAGHVDPRPIHQERGEGIGLSIVKRLCELLDASLELDSVPNVGTTFRILFPRRYEAEARR